MNFIKTPGELAPKKTLTALVYGEPGIGKSTMAVSAPNPLLFDFDGGVQRINAAHRVPTVPISRWEDVTGALQELRVEMEAGHIRIETLVIDTAGKMLDFMSEYIGRTNPKMKQMDGSLSLKGFGQRKMMFINFIKEVSVMGMNIIFVAHEREEKRGDETIKRPEIGGSSANDLIKELDLVGYMRAIGKERTITFDPTESYYAKNTCNLPENIKIPVVVDQKSGGATGTNNIFASIIKTYQDNQEASRKLTAKFEKVVSEFEASISNATNAEELNAVKDSIAGAEHIYNSKVIAGQKLNARAKELNLKFDAKKKVYVAA